MFIAIIGTRFSGKRTIEQYLVSQLGFTSVSIDKAGIQAVRCPSLTMGSGLTDRQRLTIVHSGKQSYKQSTVVLMLFRPQKV